MLVLVVVIFLAPIWWFQYIPTVDGPAHLANALILKDYGRPGSRFQEFYWINWRPLPNWTCYVLLAGFSYVLPPLIAEKVLVSLYLAGFAWSYRYFLGCFGKFSIWAAPAGFALAFNGCFWLGFYNYSLSVILFFTIMGYVLRRWSCFQVSHAAILCFLLCLIFFTHLFGFLLAVGSCLWIAATIPPRRWRAIFWLVIAVLPTSALALLFFYEAEFFNDKGFGRLEKHLMAWVEGTGQWKKILSDVENVGQTLFGIESHDSFALLAGFNLLASAFILSMVSSDVPRLPFDKVRIRSIIGLGLVFAILYFLLPNFLTLGKGGFLKTRLVFLPPLLCLSCCQESSLKLIRYLLGLVTILILSFYFTAITSYIARANRDISEFTAGLSAAGHDRVLFINFITDPMNRRRSIKPLMHAGNYYCLDSRNIIFNGHFATNLHSPVRLQPGIDEEHTDFDSYSYRSSIDIIIAWNSYLDRPPDGFHVVFTQGRLTIMEKRPAVSGPEGL